jgi:ketosteroid isomerase-like protein
LAITDLLTEINRDVWIPFRAAYAARDAQAFIALHAPDVIRFQWVEVQEGRLDIRFRFLERHASDEASSERGVYRLTLDYPDADERLWYGRFHTVCRKRGGVWRIAFDYDSDEGGTVDEELFDSGSELTEFAAL